MVCWSLLLKGIGWFMEIHKPSQSTRGTVSTLLIGALIRQVGTSSVGSQKLKEAQHGFHVEGFSILKAAQFHTHYM